MTDTGKDSPTLRRAMRYWLRLGFLSFGGPGGAIGIMHLDLVERLRWIPERRFLHALNYTMVLPGPEAQQLATYIGWLLHGRLGGLIAGILFVLPSLVMIIVLAWLYRTYGEVPWVAALLYGVKPAVLAVLLCAIWRIGSRVLHSPLLWAVAVAAFVALFLFGVAFPLVILAALLVGVLLARTAPSMLGPQSPEKEDESLAATDAPLHLPPGQMARLFAIGVVLWLGVYGLASAIDGSGTLTDMAEFFSKAAVLSFGGAYAVLPYVYQSAVEQYQWLTAAQMIDGLALRELIPGPLVLVTSFVGYLGGHDAQFLGAGSETPAAVIAALVAAWYTFLPSFLFIFIGAPLIERTRNQPALALPLASVTAAVVGVMLSLAATFAGHVVWIGGWDQAPDLPMGLMTVLALLAMTGGRVPMVPVLATCAGTGVLLKFLGA